VRFRFDIVTKRRDEERRLLAEECRLVAFAGAPAEGDWLDDATAQALLDAEPDMNVAPEQVRQFVRAVVEGYPMFASQLDVIASERAAELLESHARVREGARMTGVQYAVEAQFPPDVLGVYVFLPVGT
jgi:hypothetical protein